MSKDFITKNIRLSMEFDKAVINTPQIANKIPRGAFVMLTIAGDSQFNKNSLMLAKAAKRGAKKLLRRGNKKVTG